MFDVHITIKNGSSEMHINFIATDIQTIGPVGDRQLHFLKVMPEGKRELYAVYIDRIKSLKLEAI